MKKVLCLAMVWLVLSNISSGTIAAEQHLFLNIPFGISGEEFETLAEARTGIKFSKEESTDFIEWYYYAKPGDYIIYGSQVDNIKATFKLNGGIDQKYSGILITYKAEKYKIDDNQPYGLIIENMHFIYNALVENCGKPTKLYFGLTNMNDSSPTKFVKIVDFTSEVSDEKLEAYDNGYDLIGIRAVFDNLNFFTVIDASDGGQYAQMIIKIDE